MDGGALPCKDLVSSVGEYEIQMSFGELGVEVEAILYSRWDRI